MRTVSIVVEWENVRLSEMERCRRMLRQLDTQTQAFGEKSMADGRPTRFELIVLFNHEEVAASEVRSVVDACVDENSPHTELKLLPVEGHPYFHQKNLGASHASGELIVFIDSDVVPEEGWLQDLVGSFDSPDICVVAGNAYIDPKNLYSKAFALFWFFPLRMNESGLREAKYFFANNVGFRAETFHRFHFPERRDVSRGACAHLAETLRENDIAIHLNPRCQVSHPAPNGFSHFVLRGVAEGRNCWFNLKSTHPHKASLLRAIGRFLKSSSRGIRSAFRLRRRVGIPLFAAPFAAVLAVAYYGLRLTGEVLSRFSPGYMRTHFHD